jgi:hypothetical protein
LRLEKNQERLEVRRHCQGGFMVVEHKAEFALLRIKSIETIKQAAGDKYRCGDKYQNLEK